MINYRELRILRKKGVFGPTIRRSNESGVIMGICGAVALVMALCWLVAMALNAHNSMPTITDNTRKQMIEYHIKHRALMAQLAELHKRCPDYRTIGNGCI